MKQIKLGCNETISYLVHSGITLLHLFVKGEGSPKFLLFSIYFHLKPKIKNVFVRIFSLATNQQLPR